ncbi:putative coiled coil protein [Candidatus Ichthyocystis hellenicum]|uniref:Putative coiled coil protein n=1 Tax=Candidatus Ichthyocystis hellenicum TaxID=1561003 RepID=A0A0S4M7Q7_9BURK|nr:hypothetical protein [Candidatus Ichthyocystis hellenicum]CUT18168.1 putative coiled coil protein [Candidatus Ichthyocystis hellenicum]
MSINATDVVQCEFIKTTEFDRGRLHTLVQLSTAVIYGVNCKESLDCLVPLSTDDILKVSVDHSIDTLVQVSANEVNSKKESVDYLKMSSKEAIEAAIFVKNRNTCGYRTKYELESVGNDVIQGSVDYYEFCCNHYYRFLNNCEEMESVIYFRNSLRKILDKISNDWLLRYSFSNEDASICSVHPMYQIVHAKNTEDIIFNYHEKKLDIMSLPSLCPCGKKRSSTLESYTTSSENILRDHDPLCFLSPDYIIRDLSTSNCPYSYIIESIISPLYGDVVILTKNVYREINCLRASIGRINRKLYNLIMAILLQTKHSLDVLIKSIDDRIFSGAGYSPNVHGGESRVISSLNLIICLRKCISSVEFMKLNLMPFLEFYNFVSLEDIITMSEVVLSGSRPQDRSLLHKKEVRSLYLLLSKRYPEVIANKRMIINRLLEKINLNDESVKCKVLSLLKVQYTGSMIDSGLIIEKLIRKVVKDDIEELESNRKDKLSDGITENVDLVFVRNIVRSINNLREEISEMEGFMENLPEKISQIS